MATKSGQPINFQVANPLTFKMLLPAVKMRFWQNGGQPINFQNGQNVDNPVPLRHIYILSAHKCANIPRYLVEKTTHKQTEMAWRLWSNQALPSCPCHFCPCCHLRQERWGCKSGYTKELAESVSRSLMSFLLSLNLWIYLGDCKWMGPSTVILPPFAKDFNLGEIHEVCDQRLQTTHSWRFGAIR